MNPEVPGTASAIRRLDPLPTLAALSNPTRWKLMQLMMDGRKLSATEASAMMKRKLDITTKHLRILQQAGLLATEFHNEDRRFLMYSIREVWRPQTDVLDLGFCVLYPFGNRPQDLSAKTGSHGST